jgi:SNF2 family DNA or RNA helicase
MLPKRERESVDTSRKRVATRSEFMETMLSTDGRPPSAPSAFSLSNTISPDTYKMLSRTLCRKHINSGNILNQALMRSAITQSLDENLCDKWYAREPYVATELKRHQVDGVAFIHESMGKDGGALLADETGLGKTVTALKVICDNISRRIAYWRIKSKVPNYDNADMQEVEEKARLCDNYHTGAPLPELMMMDKDKPHARERVRGSPILVVVPKVAVSEWRWQIATHCRNLSLVYVDHHESRKVYNDGVKEYPNGKEMRGQLIKNHLDAFDVVLITYEHLRSAMKHSVIRRAYKGFNPFDEKRLARTRNALLEYYSPVSTDADKILDEWARPRIPLGHRELLDPGNVFDFMDFCMIVCDEAHKCNNAKSSLAQCIYSLCYRKALLITFTPSYNYVVEFGILLLMMHVPIPYTPNDWKAIIYEQKKGFKAEMGAADMAPIPVKPGKPVNANATMKGLKDLLHRHMLSRLGKDLGVYKFTVHRNVYKHSFCTPREIILNKLMLRVTETCVSDVLAAKERKPARRRNRRQAAEARRKKLEEGGDDDDDSDSDSDAGQGAASVPDVKASAVHNAVMGSKRIATAARTIPWEQVLGDDKEALELMTTCEDFGKNSTKCQMVRAFFMSGRVDIVNGKVLITSFFVDFLDLVGEMLGDLGIKSVKITGRVTCPDERKRLELQFMHDTGVRVCLLSLLVAQCITLTAANHLIVTDSWFSSGPTEQCLGRIARMCQLKPDVYLWYLVVEGSVEEHVHNMATKKMTTNENLMRTVMDRTRLPSNEMHNLEQLRIQLDSWNLQTVSPLVVYDEWAEKTGDMPIFLPACQGTGPTQNEIAIMERAVAALAKRSSLVNAKREVDEELADLDGGVMAWSAS